MILLYVLEAEALIELLCLISCVLIFTDWIRFDILQALPVLAAFIAVLRRLDLLGRISLISHMNLQIALNEWLVAFDHIKI